MPSSFSTLSVGAEGGTPCYPATGGPLAKSLLPLHRSSCFRCRAMAHGPGPSSLNSPQDFWGVLGRADLPASSLLLLGPGLVQGCFLSA